MIYNNILLKYVKPLKLCKCIKRPIYYQYLNLLYLFVYRLNIFSTRLLSLRYLVFVTGRNDKTKT